MQSPINIFQMIFLVVIRSNFSKLFSNWRLVNDEIIQRISIAKMKWKKKYQKHVDFRFNVSISAISPFISLDSYELNVENETKTWGKRNQEIIAYGLSQFKMKKKENKLNTINMFIKKHNVRI